MNKFTLEYLVTTSSSIYFWLFISFFVINSLYTFSNDYKRDIKRKKELGLYSASIGAVSFIMWFLFILSWFY